jgi:hypothetical protein
VQTGLTRLQDQVVQMRGLPQEQDITSVLLPADQQETALKSILEVQRWLPSLTNQGRELAALGLIRPPYDLTRYALNNFADAIGGFYVPWQNVVYVLGEKFGGVERQAYIYETAKAFIDQSYPISGMGVYPFCQIDTQRCQAIRAVLRGNAAFTTARWLQEDATTDDKTALAKATPNAQALPDEGAPPFIQRDLAFGDTQGLNFVKTLFQQGGFAQLNQALSNLPQSTEQILHPEKYLAGEAPVLVPAVPLTSTLGTGWEMAVDDVLGEWTTYLMLSAGVDEAARLPDDVAQKAAEGWGGDRVQVYYKPDSDQTVMTAEWVWDTPSDLAEFKKALTTYLDQRFQGATVDVPNQQCWSLNYQVACLVATDQSILWLLAPDLATIDRVRAKYQAS